MNLIDDEHGLNVFLVVELTDGLLKSTDCRGRLKRDLYLQGSQGTFCDLAERELIGGDVDDLVGVAIELVGEVAEYVGFS